jgi:hypothetical protein
MTSPHAPTATSRALPLVAVPPQPARVPTRTPRCGPVLPPHPGLAVAWFESAGDGFGRARKVSTASRERRVTVCGGE